MKPLHMYHMYQPICRDCWASTDVLTATSGHLWFITYTFWLLCYAVFKADSNHRKIFLCSNRASVWNSLSFERFVVQNAEYSDREHSVITVTQYFWMVTQGTHSSGTTDFFCHKSWKYFPLSCKYVWIRWITFLTHIPYQCVVEKLRSLKHKCVFCTKGKRHDWEIGQSFFQTSNYCWVIIWKEMKHRYSFMIFLFRIIKVLLFSLYEGYWAYNVGLMFWDTVCTRNCILEVSK